MTRLLLLTSILGTALTASAQTTPPPSTDAEKENRAKELVAQLGDPSYRKREAASIELASLGRFAYKALVAGMKDPDAEVWHRCNALVPEARRLELAYRIDRYLNDKEGKLEHDLPMMKVFKEKVGNDNVAKGIYAELVKNHPNILDAVEQNSSEGQRLIDVRFNDLYMQIYGGRGGAPRGYNGQEMAGLFFLMSQNDYKPALQSYMYSQFINTDPFARLIREDKVGGPYRNILLSYIEARADEQFLANSIYQFANLGLKEVVPVLLKCLETKAFNQYTKAQILGVIGGLGTKDHVEGVKKHLNDETFVQNFFNGGKPIGPGQNPRMGTILIKDIALACAIYLEGKDPKEYGFTNFVKPVGNQMMQYYNLGFMTDEERAKAFEKYTGKKQEIKKKDKDTEDPKNVPPAPPLRQINPVPLPAPDLPIDNIKRRG